MTRVHLTGMEVQIKVEHKILKNGGEIARWLDHDNVHNDYLTDRAMSLSISRQWQDHTELMSTISQCDHFQKSTIKIERFSNGVSCKLQLHISSSALFICQNIFDKFQNSWNILCENLVQNSKYIIGHNPFWKSTVFWYWQGSFY